MKHDSSHKLPSLIPVGFSAGLWLLGSAIETHRPALAQVAGDGSLGTLVNGSEVGNCLETTCTIEGGTLTSSGTTLFHSFAAFSPTAAQSVLFIDPNVSRIVARVTGGSPSQINGLIQASSGSQADLFLVNPGGIQFGATARLDLGGTLVASTAGQVLFDGGLSFISGEATPPTDALLSVSAPIGLGFLSTEASAPITVTGPGHLLAFGAPDQPSPFVNRVFQPQGLLRASAGESIVLVGNGIEFTGGQLSADGGNLELGSVSSGQVLFESAGSPGSRQLDYRQVEAYADISLAGRSLLEASASQPGQIRLRGHSIDIAESSAVLAETLPSPLTGPLTGPLAGPLANESTRSPNGSPLVVGGLIDLRASETITVRDASLAPTAPPFHSYLSVDVSPQATGPGGLLTLQAQNLRVASGGQLGASTFGFGNAGELSLNTADSIVLSGGSVLGPSGLFSVADAIGLGTGGRIAIDTAELRMDQGAQILTNSFNQALSGGIKIEADRVSLNGTSAPIPVPTIPIDMPTPDALNQPQVLTTLIQSGMGPGSRGQGNGVQIETNELTVTAGAEISTGTLGRGNAGPLTITAETVRVSGFSPVTGPSALLTTVRFGATGEGGALTIDTGQLTVANGAQVATSTAGPGRAGDLTVNSTDVQLIGSTPQGRSGLFATAIGSTGAGGNLTVNADTLTVEAGATVSVSNFPSGANSPIPPGRGAAGDLRVNVGQIALADGSSLSADTAEGDRGNILLQTDLLTLRRGSRITTNATGTATGGNIEINATGFVIAVPDENSDITANAVFGDGGQVEIAAQDVLGLTARPAPTNQSDITASSEFGLAGDTQVETIDPDVRTGDEPLPQSTETATVLQGCTPGGEGSSRFIQSGRGGVSSSPYGVLNNRETLADTSVPESISADVFEANIPETNPTTAITEAQGWGVNQQGEIVLTAATSDQVGRRCG